MAHLKQKRLLLPGWGIAPQHYHSLLQSKEYDDSVVDYGFFSEQNISPTEALKQYDLENTQHIVAHSLGVLLFLNNIDCFKQLKSISLISPCLRFTEDEPYPGQPQAVVEAMIKQLEQKPAIVLKTFARSVFLPSRGKFRPEAVLNTENLKQGLRDLLTIDLRNKVTTPIPTLLFHGTEDTVIPFSAAKYVEEQLSNSKLIVFADNGHGIPFTHSQEIAIKINTFQQGGK